MFAGPPPAATFGRSMYKYDLNQDTVLTSVYKNPVQPGVLNLNVFPNPFSSRISVSFISPLQQTGKFEIYDLSGRKLITVFEGILVNGTNIITRESSELNNLKAGVYMIKLSAGNQVVSKKILHKKD